MNWRGTGGTKWKTSGKTWMGMGWDGGRRGEKKWMKSNQIIYTGKHLEVLLVFYQATAIK